MSTLDISSRVVSLGYEGYTLYHRIKTRLEITNSHKIVDNSHRAQWKIGVALSATDRFRKFRLPPCTTGLEPDLDRRSILELTNGTPLGVVTVNTDSIEVHEAETWQGNSRNDGGIWLRTLIEIFM